MRGNLQGNTNGKDDAAEQDGDASTKPICQVTCKDGTKKGARG